MATRTLKAKYENIDGSLSMMRVILCHSANRKEIYYQYENAIEAPVSDQPAEAPLAPLLLWPFPLLAPLHPLAWLVASIEDVPVRALDILHIIVAQKLKKKVNEMPLSKSIKDLVGGKSMMQNKILGGLQQEFLSAPEKAEELPLEELGSSWSSGFGGNLGKYSMGLILRLVSGKMPGAFNASAIKTYLSKTWGLGPLRLDGVLLLTTTLEPPKRLGSEAEAKSWLDDIVSIYSQRAGITLGGAAGGAEGSSGGTVINSEEFLKFQANQNNFASQQIEVYMRYLDCDSRAGELAFDKEKNSNLALQAKLDNITCEHGDAYLDGIQPRLDPLKARHFDSSWNWALQDALFMNYDIIHGRLTAIDHEITARCIAILDRADENLFHYMQYHINRCDPSKEETYKLAKSSVKSLLSRTVTPT